jgi:alpha-tubulin suppressor-like RCC1 family protein
VQAACGERHSIALTNAGEIYMWGNFNTFEEKKNMKIEHTLKNFVSTLIGQ